MDPKELFIQAHEELIEEYFEKHPNASYEEAFEATQDKAYDRHVEKFADMVDQVRMTMKDRNL